MSKKLTTKEFQNRLIDIYGDRFEVISEYVNNETKIKVRCKVCNSIILKKPVKMTGSTHEGCYVCSGKNKHKTTQSFIDEVNKKFPNKYEIMGEYVNARTPLNILNKFCNHTYCISPDNLLRGKGCPKCSIRQSSYMDIVENILIAHQIKFCKEKTFYGCKKDRLLPFDYYLPDFNCCIEVDGEFHYQRGHKNFKNKHSKLNAVCERDAIKTDFCVKNNIKLIRLPYFEKEKFNLIIMNELHMRSHPSAAARARRSCR